MPGHNRRRPGARQSKQREVAAEALSVELLIIATAVDDDLLTGCPVNIMEPTAAGPSQQQTKYMLQMEEWLQVGELLSWFVTAVLSTDKTARLSFAASLPKDCRADVHNLVSKKYSRVSESVSEGFGDERHVAVVAKGASGARQLTSEQADHALALYYLHKQQRRQQEKQQKQLAKQREDQQVQLQQQHEQQQHQQQQQQQQSGAEAELQAANLDLQVALQLQQCREDSQEGLSVVPAAAAPVRDYTRDEVAQMLAQDKLPGDLSLLWHGPAGEAQRQARLICLAASAGDVEQVQAIISAQPDLAVSSTLDLSSGGQLPLHLAAAAGSVEVLQLLLAAGADVAATNGAGETALQVAQRCEECDCEALLLQAGAVNTQQDSWRETFNGEL